MELITESRDDEVVRIRVLGGIQQKQLNNLDEHLRAAVDDDVYRRKVLLDLSENDYIDSSGISWLLICHKRFKENGGRMVLHSLPRIVEDSLKILRLELVFALAKSADEAVKMANEPEQDTSNPTDVAGT